MICMCMPLYLNANIFVVKYARVDDKGDPCQCIRQEIWENLHGYRCDEDTKLEDEEPFLPGEYGFTVCSISHSSTRSICHVDNY